MPSLVSATAPRLVRDINPTPGPGWYAVPELFETDGDFAYFFADDPDHGRELWVTDGTAAGTRLVRDLCPGKCSWNPRGEWVLGDRLLFRVHPSGTGERRLWSSDGTWEGTRDLGAPAMPFGEPFFGYPVAGEIVDRELVLFAAGNEESPRLWATDGTPAGTRPLGPSAPESRPLAPRGWSVGNAPLLFGAFSAEHGRELWASDGTDAGTRRVADLTPGSGFSNLHTFRQLPNGSTLFFRSLDFDTELWVSDGSAAGTRRLEVFSSNFEARVILPVVVTSEAAYFIGLDENGIRQIWRSDGTPAGSGAISEFGHEAFEGSNSYSGRIAALDDGVLFTAAGPDGDVELWRADALGARRLVDICPGSCSSDPLWLNPYHDEIYFQANNGVTGTELWISDGTSAGTRQVHDGCPGACGSFPYAFEATAGLVFFWGASSSESGTEIWATDGTSQGTIQLTDFMPADPLPNSGNVFFTSADLGDHMLFTADDGDHGWEVWRSDGTVSGTGLVEDVFPGRRPGADSYPQHLTPMAGGVFFFAKDESLTFQPWFSDGTPGGTRRLGTISTFAEEFFSSAPYSTPAIHDDFAIFFSIDPASDTLELWRARLTGESSKLATFPGDSYSLNGRPPLSVASGVVFFVNDELWSTDGSVAGTRVLAQLDSGPGVSFAGQAFFGANDLVSSTGTELWSTDGTVDGTRRVRDIDPGPFDSRPVELTVASDRLFFTADTDEYGRELWKTDGSTEGTVLVRDVLAGPEGSDPSNLTVVGDLVYFFPRRPGGELWVSDGTEEGTRLVAAAPAVFQSFDRVASLGVAGRLWWIAWNGTGGQEVWTSDGTAEGTRSLQALIPGRPQELGRLGEQVVVVTYTSSFATEIWLTDGTFQGTRRLATTPHPGFFTELTDAGARLFLQGTDPAAGTELLALDPGPAEPCSPSDTTLCLLEGRFAVTARWYDPRSATYGVGHAAAFPGSSRTGTFWFFDEDNVELVVKALNGRPINGWFWNFYGALSDVEYWIEVTDTASGRTREYHNPAGNVCGRGDTTAFPATPGVLGSPAATNPTPPDAQPAAPTPGGAACGGGPGDLCLLDDRFRVEVEWHDHRSGDTGVGTAIPHGGGSGAAESGFFWFFDQENVELVVKVLDGRTVNGKFWVFYGALSDVEYTITVTDTETDTEAVYSNPPGEICGRGDTTAF